MLKKNWEMPVTVVQKFEPNEYVAACYTLACLVGNGESAPYGAQWNQDHWWVSIETDHSPLGTPDTCGDKNANRILTNASGVITNIDEHNYDQGWIPGALDKWYDENNNDICDPGDVIYWHTYSSDGKRRWNHWGYAAAEDVNHPNHS